MASSNHRAGGMVAVRRSSRIRRLSNLDRPVARANCAARFRVTTTTTNATCSRSHNQNSSSSTTAAAAATTVVNATSTTTTKDTALRQPSAGVVTVRSMATQTDHDDNTSAQTNQQKLQQQSIHSLEQRLRHTARQHRHTRQVYEQWEREQEDKFQRQAAEFEKRQRVQDNRHVLEKKAVILIAREIAHIEASSSPST